MKQIRISLIEMNLAVCQVFIFSSENKFNHPSEFPARSFESPLSSHAHIMLHAHCLS